MTWSAERGESDSTVLTRDDSFPVEKIWGRREVRPALNRGWLKSELQTKLNRAGATGTNDRVGSSNIWCGTPTTEESATTRRIVVCISVLPAEWIGEIRVIENIEELRTELGSEMLTPLEVLGHGEIHVLESRIAEDVASHGAEGAECGRDHEGLSAGVAAKSV